MPLKHGDLDGDGRSEIPVSSPWGIGVYEMVGGALGVALAVANGTRLGDWLLNTADNRFELMADLDGDGRCEVLVSSPWGIGILKQSGKTYTSAAVAANGTRLGDWVLNTVENRFGPVGDFDGDGKAEVLVTSPWGVGILKLSAGKLTVLAMAANGTRFGGWQLNTADNRFAAAGDLNGDGRAEILVTSPWGLGVLQLSGQALTALTLVENGGRIGSWLVDTSEDHIAAVADLDGDGWAEILVTSALRIGVLEMAGDGTLYSLQVVPAGTRFGDWQMNTLDTRLGPVGDFDGDGRTEVLMVSPWGIGVLEVAGGVLGVKIMAANGSKLGYWTLDTAANRFDMAGDFDGDGQAELLAVNAGGLAILKVVKSTFDSIVIAGNSTSMGGWKLNTADNRFGIGPELLRVHIKILSNPAVHIDRMMSAMQRVYESVGIIVQRASTEVLDLPDLVDLEAGACVRGSVTEEQELLFDHRANMGPNDVVAYFVRSTNPPYNGCAAHPPGQPGAVVCQGATQWTLGHELGHVLGLPHVADSNRLMTGGGTANITNPPPDFIHTEVQTMKGSALTHNA